MAEVQLHHNDGYDYGYGWVPVGAPLNTQRQQQLERQRQQQQQHVREEQSLRDFDNSVNAVSFGFVATAILISMFLVMAIFERFLRQASPEISPSGRRNSHSDLEAQLGFNPKLGHSSPKMSIYARGVSVLMPGEEIPTFIAHPAPVPCPPERVSWPQHSPPPLNSISHAFSASQVPGSTS